MVVALVELFERMWREAVPMYPQATPSEPVGGPAPGRTGSAWISTWISTWRTAACWPCWRPGSKDDAIARQFGTSPRSACRRLRHLFDELNAETRFQAGAQASRRGLV